ncbi:hypothetical protein [Streptomyces hygroscopicus]|uniref:hypothetical protein n=1 Tax=Streptomyces hygroscopicus TaxID=1912 RepID=UPI001FCBEA73|nr:hypothetical protein [Streptomyces hygroscopicus]BDH10481.1 hypothetical protein HOK021_16600 [Streptomyces hygroscopicus]
MDEPEQSKQETPGELNAEQRDLLSTFAMKRAARMAVASGQSPELPDLKNHLAEMDDEFAAHPDHDNPLVQENHELRRLVVIQEYAIRMLVPGHLSGQQS